jgi:ATP-dependent Clp protease ATP-binding subunit ClpA
MSQNDPKIEALVERLFQLTRGYKHEYVTLEHLLAILLETEEVQDIFYDIDKDPKVTRDLVITYLENEVDSIDKEEFQPQKTVMLERVFNRAFTQAMFNGRQKLDPRDLLISILTEEQSPSVVLLNQLDITREDLISYLTNEATEEAEANTRDKPLKQERILEKFCDNLNMLANNGEIDPMIGRETEL